MEGNLQITGVSLTFLLIVIAIGLSYYQKLGVEKELGISSVRTVIQLMIMGYVLEYVLSIEHFLVVILILFCMTLFGAYTSSKRSFQIEGVFFISFISILLGVTISLGVVLVANSIALKAQYVIPISSMIISTSMNANSLALTRLRAEIISNRHQIEAALCLGATTKQASNSVIKSSIKAALIPSIDRAKTVGIVTLPGSMTGMIFAGISPLYAIKYQLLIECILIGSIAISVFCSTLLSYRKFFTTDDALDIQL
ncbi:ABC transporter permease [Gottfriedia solisilvae]|uniref:Iron export ABC transporter permease subunit FetB n=1 Tax=Gottfriedia solisilvae TaxID=1516104 RepID=A0A8J3ARV8_9BACI|nr:iron export ABC transporter permease subunit FetB [Gottfriedia solisilvae]GGI15491.1 iron export ABC transporter permease subunit FetB [Gottfriedia solisilvae]